MQFNRGEWSELYALLELLDNQDLNIVNDNLEIIDDSTFKVLGLYLQNNNNEYYFDIKDIDIDVLKNNRIISNVEKADIQKYKEVLLNKIVKEFAHPLQVSRQSSPIRCALTRVVSSFLLFFLSG